MRRKPVLIIDADESSQKIISDFLEDSPDFFVAHICNNGLEAKASVEIYQPELIFMEMELPGKDGLSLMEELQDTTSVIITTTQEIYAAKAFMFNVIDYLLKPFSRSRFEQALHKYKARFQDASDLPTSQYAAPFAYPNKILVAHGRKFVSLSVDEITHMKAEREYTKIFTLNKQVFLSGYGISEMERKMDPGKFLRIHRSYLVNVAYIRELYKDISRLFIALPNNVEVSVGRRYLPVVKQLIF